MADLKDLAASIISRLKAEGFTIQRYNAYSSNSIYLKLDCGVCNSIRISDHKGKEHLSYRYNVIKGCQSPYSIRTGSGLERHFYPIHRVDKLIKKILKDRKHRIVLYGSDRYKVLIETNLQRHQNDRGFWKEAEFV